MAVRVTVGGVLVVPVAVLGFSGLGIFLGVLRLYESLCCVSNEALTVTTLTPIAEEEAIDRVCILPLLLARVGEAPKSK